MGVKVCKFGGTSLADAQQFRKVQAIIQGHPDRRYVVPSAPGKRSNDDQKITDLLYLCHELARQSVPIDDVFQRIAARYRQIVADLGMQLDLTPHLEAVRTAIPLQGADYAASRGEALNGLIVADLLGFDYIDAAEVIFFDRRGRFDAAKTQQTLSDRLARHPRAVIPGFYGALPNGTVKTFSRGGSDITGAIVARAAGAAMYENWTDVPGLLMADPRIVRNPKPIRTVTYSELRELAYMGATVLHPDAIRPVREAGIPINIRNTNEPDAPGTTIVADALGMVTADITGVAGRPEFTVITIAKALMNEEVGFGRRVLTVLESNGINFEHMPSGIDTISVVVSDQQLNGKLDKVVAEIRAACQPDSVEVRSNIALIATVGRGMAHRPGIAARLFTALAQANVNVVMIDQGWSEMNIIVGVTTEDYEKSVRAIYQAFVK